MVSAARSTILVAGVVVASVLVTGLLAGCAGSDEVRDTATSSVGTPTLSPVTTELTTTELTTTALTTTVVVTTGLSTTALPEGGPATEPPSTAPPTEPTGAPGIDDDDEFCSAWARAVGIPQILTIAANFGGLDTSGMARLEVLAAPTVDGAVATLEATLPAALESERDVWFTRVLGPIASRADRAVSLLVAAGASTEQLSDLDSAWLDALRARDPSSPVPSVQAQDPALEEIVDAAAAQFDAQVTPWLDDPALIVDDSLAPGVAAYTRDHCPDLSDLGIGDDI